MNFTREFTGNRILKVKMKNFWGLKIEEIF